MTQPFSPAVQTGPRPWRSAQTRCACPLGDALRSAAGAGRRLTLLLLTLTLATGVEAAEFTLRIGLIDQSPAAVPPLSALLPPIVDDGLEGARQGLRDNATTGRFTGQAFELVPTRVAPGTPAAAAFRDLHGQGLRVFSLVPTLQRSLVPTLQRSLVPTLQRGNAVRALRVRSGRGATALAPLHSRRSRQRLT